MTCLSENANDYFSEGHDPDYCGQIVRDDEWQHHFVMQETYSVEIANAIAKLIGHEVQGVRVGYDVDGDPEVVTTTINRITGDINKTAFRVNTYQF